MALGILIPVSILAFLAVLIAMGVFMVQRLRAGESLVLSFRTILLAYFHLMTITSFLVLTAGFSTGVKAGLSDAFGREFSYYMPPAVRFMPPGPSGEDRRSAKPTPTPEEERERGQREAQRQYQNDLIRGVTLVVVGGIIWGLHVVGRRRLETPEEPSRAFFSKAATTILLAIFGIVGVISLPMGVYELLRFFIVPTEEFMSRQPPGSTVATAIVFVPCWLYYLLAVLRQSRQEV